MRHNPRISAISPFRDTGFTLIELVLATAISALVIGIISVCLSFALRAWESTQNRRPDQSAALVSLLKSQLAEWDPTPVKFEDGKYPFFSGHPTSLAFATDHSVKAITKGVPVVARYLYDPKTKLLYYAEIPFDPYHQDNIKDFVTMKPDTGENAAVRFYVVEMDGFGLSYSDGEKGSQFSDNWDQRDKFPSTVLVKWSTREAGDFSQAIEINLPFTIEIDKKAGTRPVGLQ